MVLLLPVAESVPLTLIVLTHERVLMNVVLILVLVPVLQTLNVEWLITKHFAIVCHVTLVIHSFVAPQWP